MKHDRAIFTFDSNTRAAADFSARSVARIGDAVVADSLLEAVRLAQESGAAEVVSISAAGWVYTADRALVEDAHPVPLLSYREAIELSALGYPGMPTPTELAAFARAGVKLRLASLDPLHEGSRIEEQGPEDPMRPTCVASLPGLVLLDVEGRAAPVVAAVASTGVDVLFEAQAPHGLGVAFAVRRADAPAVRAAIEAASGTAPQITSGVAMVTLVGESTARTANVSGRFFGALGTLGIDVKAIAQRANGRTIAALVAETGLATAVRAIHSAFNLSAEEVNVLLLGKGVVGGEFLRQLGAERATLARDHGVNLRLVGVVDRRAIVYDERGIDPAEVTARLAAAPARGAASARELLPRFGELPVPVLVDCTAEDGMEKVYHTAFAAGAHVVAANKKPLTVALDARKELFAAARRAHRAYRYETTVGASLPVIETLKNLLRTGDRVRKIEGSFSGTLGFLSNELARGVALVDAVRDAKARGFTEPHPRDDLSGADAARKALILARELGMPLELEQVEVVPFVPAELLVHDDVEAFFQALERHQEQMAADIAERAARGEVLRHLATVDPVSGTARVAPTFVPNDHPSTRLRGTEGFVAFYTDRYAEYPLVVQGAGAGGAVTAAGVLADVLALSQSLRGA